MLRTYTIALLTFLCSITSLSAADYHWVGGSGNWSDLNHWATTSGGSIHPQIVPSPFDDIFFDGNSGFVVGDVYYRKVTLKGDEVIGQHKINPNLHGTFSTTSYPNSPILFDTLILQAGRTYKFWDTTTII
jgi:hypothetical protein